MYDNRKKVSQNESVCDLRKTNPENQTSERIAHNCKNKLLLLLLIEL